MPTKKEDLPGTLKRSPKKAQRTYAKTLDSAEEQYDSEERAHRTAWSAVKHSFEKVGDHWEAKDEKGPSDPQAERSGKAARDRQQVVEDDVRLHGDRLDQPRGHRRRRGDDEEQHADDDRGGGRRVLVEV